MSAVLQPNYYPKFTSEDLAVMPEDGKLYEIIEGDLYVSRQPNWHHQFTCCQIFRFLQEWNDKTKLGVANAAPGLLYGDDVDVAPDVVWVSMELLAQVLGEDGKLHGSPELVVEVISPGWNNQIRDRQTKLKLYSRRGVQEYWVVDWQQQTIEIHRRNNEQLTQICTLHRNNLLTSPLLPDFSCQVADLFFPPQLPKNA